MTLDKQNEMLKKRPSSDSSVSSVSSVSFSGTLSLMHMQRFFGFLGFLGLFGFLVLGLPAEAAAKESRIFQFAAGEVNATWVGKGPISMKQGAQGILLSTTGTGLLLTDTDIGIFPQAGSITVSSDRETELYFVWILDSDPNQRNYDIAMTIPAGSFTNISFPLEQHEHWLNVPKKIGVVLPPHTTVILHQIELTQWNPWERFVEFIHSFWTFDGYRPYSINFLWGPQLSTNPVGRENLFSYQPPILTSATYVLNGVLLVCIAILALVFFFSGNHSCRRIRLLKSTVGLFLVAWVFLDMRMGSEFLSYVTHDLTSYVFSSSSFRTFRDRDQFYDFAAFAVPYVFDRQNYVFFAEREWPYLGNMRYLSYPAIPGIAYDRDDTWVIYRRPDMVVGEDGRITVEGVPVSEPGRVLGRFDEFSYVFRTLSAPSAPQ
jgi:hypothetical protein